MDHPLNNIPIELSWLTKPVSGLVNKINIAIRRPPTRSSMDDYCSGKDTYIHATYCDASKFISVEYDDVELVDIVVDNPKKCGIALMSSSKHASACCYWSL